MRKMIPTLITEEAINHIQSKPGRGHIKEHEISEVLNDPKKRIERNKDSARADFFIKGCAYNGKTLVVCVKLRSGNPYWSEVVTAWEVK
jgi:hypothetical protein